VFLSICAVNGWFEVFFIVSPKKLKLLFGSLNSTQMTIQKVLHP
jgi:hypothetical protein